jgi:ATP-binding cassette, subfamily B, multidrug efflux pump
MKDIFKNFNKKDVFMIICCVFLIVFQVYLDLKLPDYMSKITILIQSGTDSINDILIQGLHMVLCAFGSFLSACVVGFLVANVGASFSRNTRKKIFEKVESFGLSEINKFSTSSLITRTTNDVTQVETLLVIGLQMIIKSPIMAIWAITKILGKSLELSALTGVCVAVLLFTVGILMVVVIPRFEIVQRLIDKLNCVTRENFSGIRVIRAFNAEEFQKNRFDDVNNELTKTQMFNQRCFAVLNPVINLCMHFLSLGIYFIGAFLLQKLNLIDKINFFSNMVVFTSYGIQVLSSFLMLAMIFMVYPRAKVSAKRINEVLDEEISLVDGKIDDVRDEGTVEFKNVSFQYPDADECLLENISFKANKGETIAFIGSTGSGKSTLINLIPRFYDVTGGKILVDGVDVRDYKQSVLHNKIGYVSQKAVMFTGTVESNVNYGDSGKSISEEQIIKAIDVAQGTDFVSKMEDGYTSHIARGGTNVSGGQKQRLSIARAVAKNPEIYIFDDTFSALDYKTDLTLRQELRKYTKDATCLIVAQRIGTIINADKIIVLDKGKCVGMGTHKELLKKCEVYKEIALSQLSEEELKNA